MILFSNSVRISSYTYGFGSFLLSLETETRETGNDALEFDVRFNAAEQLDSTILVEINRRDAVVLYICRNLDFKTCPLSRG